MKKCLNISEEVVLPEIHEIEEHLVMDPPVQCEETVSVPAIVQKPRWIPDIEWGDLEECPKDSVWFVVTDELPSAIGRPHVQFSSFYDQYFIDWGGRRILCFSDENQYFGLYKSYLCQRNRQYRQQRQRVLDNEGKIQ